MTARSNETGERAVSAPLPSVPFKAPKFRVWPNGKLTGRASGQRFHIEPEGGEFVLRHFAFRSYVDYYECIARYETMEDARAAAVEIARMGYENPDGFQKPDWLEEAEERCREESVAKWRAKQQWQPPAPTPRQDEAKPRGGGLAYLLESFVSFAAEGITDDHLTDELRYRLAAGLATTNRVVRSLLARGCNTEAGTVIQFPGRRS